MKVIITTAAVIFLAGCQTDKEYVRQEIQDSRAFIDKSCGSNEECRWQLAQAEAARIGHDLQAREATRERVAAAMRQWSANQAAMAAARQANRPVTTNCNRFGNTITCNSY
jgi:hypothetical protein